MTATNTPRRTAQQAAYENGRSDARWKIPAGSERRNRYTHSGHSAMFARAWDRGWDEVAAELAAPTKEDRDAAHD